MAHTKKVPVSVFIIAMNEADRIGRTLESVIDWADDIVVVDSGSRDDTVAISQSHGAKTFFNAWQGYGQQKRFAESVCKNNWVLNIDADEQVSADLRNEIVQMFAIGEPPFAAYTVQRVEILKFQRKPRPWSHVTNWVRLYRRDHAGFRNHAVHDTVEVRMGKLGDLNGRLYHNSFRSYSHQLDKINAYTSLQARDLFNAGRKPSWLKLMITPPLAFLKALLIRRMILFGIDGIVESYFYSFSRLVRLAKTRELYRLAEKKRK
ncbi:MAG TPA: glycosyltransferase family 2 protein [Alphaproteobacteria bacterium]|nr:glycosyltransferase family 2 protein [Alphaproteobacteria bacterium]